MANYASNTLRWLQRGESGLVASLIAASFVVTLVLTVGEEAVGRLVTVRAYNSRDEAARSYNCLPPAEYIEFRGYDGATSRLCYRDGNFEVLE